MRRIVIIGGGFSGAACALHLLRDHPDVQADLKVIEPRAVLGAGLAYSAQAAEHRVNVAAARMSVFPEIPLHFHEWAQREVADDPDCAMPDGRLYPQRAVFGRYVDATLRDAVAAHKGVRFSHLRTRAEGVRREAAGLRVVLDDGGEILADLLVLAVSHTAPDVPARLRGLPGVVANPWDLAAVDTRAGAAPVLILGTGLTACDVIARLLARGHSGAIVALSRHGLLPRPRTSLPVVAEGDFVTAPALTASSLLRRVRHAMRVAMAAGRPWENVVDALRQQCGSAWGSLSWEERRRLLRHARTYWDVHRFQCAPQIDNVVKQAQARGQLRVMAARLDHVQPRGDGLAARVLPRGAQTVETLDIGSLIVCTGPGHRSVTESHPALRDLARSGDLQADPARLGIYVDAQSRVIGQDGQASGNLFVAGPLARGTHGELMGLPQVTLQPRAVAASLAALCAA